MALMAKNSNYMLLQRWVMLDGWLHWASKSTYVRAFRLSDFAQIWGVSERTIRRDLSDFQSMGQRLVQYGRALDKRSPHAVYQLYAYAEGVKPLFTRNLKGDAWWERGEEE
jgi:hypothetical protein